MLFSRFKLLIIVLSFILSACSSSGGSEGGETLRSCTSSDVSACTSSEYCRFPDGTCGALDETGRCETVPEVCSQQFEPTCGCDGTTYSNSCGALMAAQSIVSFNACDSLRQATGRVCGADGAIACRSDSFCNFLDLSCGARAAIGFCTQTRLDCDITSDPVCGCDGVTYQNTCFAQAATVSVDFESACF